MVTLEELVAKVAPEWRSSFVRFVETGEADEGFLNHLDRDEDAQQAVELAFSAQSAALEGLAQALRESDEALAAAAPARPAVAQPIETMSRAVEAAVKLPAVERHAVFTAALTIASEGIPSKIERRELFAELKHAVSEVEAVVEKW